jgi:hypothetical protein
LKPKELEFLAACADNRTDGPTARGRRWKCIASIENRKHFCAAGGGNFRADVGGVYCPRIAAVIARPQCDDDQGSADQLGGMAGGSASANLAMGGWVHSGPVEMIRAWMAAAQKNNGAEYGPGSLLVRAGMPATMAARLCAVVFMSAALVVMGVLRKLPMLSLFGLASGFGRLWTYHRVYDNVMLIFLLVALAVGWFRDGSRWVCAAILLLGFTVWFPIHSIDVWQTHLLHVLIWMAAMAVLAVMARGEPAASATGPA